MCQTGGQAFGSLKCVKLAHLFFLSCPLSMIPIQSSKPTLSMLYVTMEDLVFVSHAGSYSVSRFEHNHSIQYTVAPLVATCDDRHATIIHAMIADIYATVSTIKPRVFVATPTSTCCANNGRTTGISSASLC